MQTTTTIIINRPIGAVWEYFTDPANLPQWAGGFERYEPLSGRAGEVGARARRQFRRNGIPLELIEEITEKEPFRVIAYRLHSPLAEVLIRATLMNLGSDRTAFVSVFDTTFKLWLLRRLAPMMRKALRQSQEADLQRFKAALEAV